VTAAEALVNSDLLRDIAYRAKADRRVVMSLLRGEAKQRPSAARARARAELIAVGVIFQMVTVQPVRAIPTHAPEPVAPPRPPADPARRARGRDGGGLTNGT
jgi:hypothetical protein